MDILQGLDIGNGIIIALVCGGLCVVGIIFLFFMQFITGALGALSGLLELFFGILQGGPIAWCGCLVFFMICGACSVVMFSIISVIPQCSTPEAVNLCRFLGY